jgi:hypothetical protein
MAKSSLSDSTKFTHDVEEAGNSGILARSAAELGSGRRDEQFRVETSFIRDLRESISTDLLTHPIVVDQHMIEIKEDEETHHASLCV